MPSCKTFFLHNWTTSVCFCVLVSLIVFFVVTYVGFISKNVINGEEEYLVATIPRTYSESEGLGRDDVFKDLLTSFMPREDFVLIHKDVNATNYPNGPKKFRREVYYAKELPLLYDEALEMRERVSSTYDVILDDSSNETQQSNGKRPQAKPEYDSDYYEDPNQKTMTNPEGNALPLLSTGNINHEFWTSYRNRRMIRQTQARMMSQYMDTSVSPCDDFYQFACGNWASFNKIPADRTTYNTFEILRSNLDTVLNDLLELKNHSSDKFPGPDLQIDASIQHLFNSLNKRKFKTINNISNSNTNHKTDKDTKTTTHKSYEKSTPDYEYQDYYLAKRSKSSEPSDVKEDYDEDAILKAKNFYTSCVNEHVVKERGSKPLLDLLDMLGGWPILSSNWRSTYFDWVEIMATLRHFNNDVLISTWVGLDMKDSNQYVIQLDQTSLGLPAREYFLHEAFADYLNAYRKYLIEVCILLEGDESYVKWKAEELIAFEIELAKITAPPERRNNITELYQRVTIYQLTETFPGIEWGRFLSMIVERIVEPNEEVVLLASDYMQKLTHLLKGTNPEVICNYLLWRFVKNRVSNLDDRFRIVKQKFYLSLYGRQESPPRWRTCVSVVNNNMGMVVGAMFVKEYFDETSKLDNIEITKDIQSAFKELISDVDWMDATTKELAIHKLQAILIRIGYPDYILDKEELDKKFKGLQIDPGKYFENSLNILYHTTKTDLERLYEPVDKSIWNTFPAVVNAYYSRNKNQIMFPAGILQPPFYHKYFPRCLNYGGIGVVIGHEITHGFDDKGRMFDSNGNMLRWWFDSDVRAFHERSQCIVQQYGNFRVPEVNMNINGGITQGENIADNGGIKQAFKAYSKWADLNSEYEETLPGLNYTSKQLFFINFAQIWCGEMRTETMKNKIRTSVHPPGKFRVIGTLSNSEDFAREFKCPIGSPMNPSEKCTVW